MPETNDVDGAEADGEPPSPELPDQLGFRPKNPALVERLDEIAIRRSEPGKRVSRSELLREATEDFVDRHTETEQPAD